MKEYVKGHKDSAAINEYLNTLPEDAKEFLVVYQLRKMGEDFVDGTLKMGDVIAFDALCKSPAIAGLNELSSTANAFIHQMKCWTFYTTLRAIASGNDLTPFQQKVKDEIEHPSFCKPIPKGKVALTLYKLERIWKTRWKHPLVFNEPPLARVITHVWSVVRIQKVVKD